MESLVLLQEIVDIDASWEEVLPPVLEEFPIMSQMSMPYYMMSVWIGLWGPSVKDERARQDSGQSFSERMDLMFLSLTYDRRGQTDSIPETPRLRI